MRTAVVIVAGGRGSRLEKDGAPKQYRDVAGKTLLQRTIECFAGVAGIDAIQVVIHPDDEALYQESVKGSPLLLSPVFGGATRQESCRAGVSVVAGSGYERVLVHDAARPFVSARLIVELLGAIKPGFCVLPVFPVSETVKRVSPDGEQIETIDRDGLYLAQTPQGFMAADIHVAHEAAREADINHFTDDAAVAEWYGLRVKTVPGDRANFKVTGLDDLQEAREILMTVNSAAVPDTRTGTGYDVHQLVSGDGVILCGVPIGHHKKLAGHSDADVGLHALTDAILGAIGKGDIGSHFPPSEEKWKGASSDQFLMHAGNLVSEAGGRINNLDVTIICEEPKIGPHRDAMRQSISRILGLAKDRISVKATTHEKIGSIGRREGIAALAVATVSITGDEG